MSNRLLYRVSMKLNPATVKCSPGRVIQQFGEARLVRHHNGKHELIGGDAADLATAREWVSLFAHDIVFSRACPEPTVNCRQRKKTVPLRFFSGETR
jgi:hypothetical protein